MSDDIVFRLPASGGAADYSLTAGSLRTCGGLGEQPVIPEWLCPIPSTRNSD